MDSIRNKIEISCILAVNRFDEYLDMAIKSVLFQTFRDFELIIIANNCSDELWEYLERIDKTDDRIVIKRTFIGQLVFNLNYGIDLSKGKYIARMDADDISLPFRFEKQFEFMEKNQDVNVVATNFVRINIYEEIISDPLVAVFNDKDIRNKLRYSNPIAHPSLMFRREDLLNNKGYSWSFWGEDYEYHLRCSRDIGYKFHCLEDVLLHYRVSPNQMTANNNNICNYADECALLFREWLISGDIRYLIRIIRLNRKVRTLYRKIINIYRGLFVKENN